MAQARIESDASRVLVSGFREKIVRFPLGAQKMRETCAT